MILFYAADQNRVVETLEQQTADFKVVRCRTFETLTRRLRKPRHGLEVALVVVSGRDEMSQISSIRNLLRDMRLIVVLPCRDEETIAWAHTFGPRFIAYADNGCDQVGAVLEKLMQATRRQPAAVEVGL